MNERQKRFLSKAQHLVRRAAVFCTIFFINTGVPAQTLVPRAFSVDQSSTNGRKTGTYEVYAMENALRVEPGFAKQLVNTTKLALLKRLSAAGEPSPASSCGMPSASGGVPPADQHVLTISSNDFAGAEQKLKAEASTWTRRLRGLFSLGMTNRWR